MALAPRVALGCDVCYGDAEGPMIEASRASVGLMLGFVVFFQVVFGVFFVRLWRRMRRYQRDGEAATPTANGKGAV